MISAAKCRNCGQLIDLENEGYSVRGGAYEHHGQTCPVPAPDRDISMVEKAVQEALTKHVKCNGDEYVFTDKEWPLIVRHAATAFHILKVQKAIQDGKITL